MDLWWWVLIGLAAWFLVALGIALFIGPVLRRSSQAWEALDQQLGEIPGKLHEPPRIIGGSRSDEREAAEPRPPAWRHAAMYRPWRQLQILPPSATGGRGLPASSSPRSRRTARFPYHGHLMGAHMVVALLVPHGLSG